MLCRNISYFTYNEYYAWIGIFLFHLNPSYAISDLNYENNIWINHKIPSYAIPDLNYENYIWINHKIAEAFHLRTGFSWFETTRLIMSGFDL